MARSSTSFAPGNTAAVTHGARSQKLREEKRKAVLDSIASAVESALPDPAAGDGLLIQMLATQLADLSMLRDYINRNGGPISERGQLYKAMEMLRAREKDAQQTMDRLGIGPKAGTLVLSKGGEPASGSFAVGLARRRALTAMDGGQQ